MADQYLSHRNGRHRHEMRAIPEIAISAAEQLDVRLVHERRGVEGLGARLTSTLNARDVEKLVVDEREESARRARISAPDFVEEHRHRCSRLHAASPVLRPAHARQKPSWVPNDQAAAPRR
jgi:hypothetical protein